MNYELELLKIFGLENHAVQKLELVVDAENRYRISLNARILIEDKHGEEVVRLLKKYKVEEIKE